MDSNIAVGSEQEFSETDVVSQMKSLRRTAMKRSKHEIFSKILEVCLNGANKTKIVYQANLNFRTVNPYLQTLVRNNLLVASQGKHTIYRTTDQGKSLEESINHITNKLILY